MYFFSNSEVYLKYTSFHQKSKSINAVLLKYKQTIYLLLFSNFILHLYFFVGSSRKAWALIDDLKYKWNILEVYLSYTSHTAFSVMEELSILLTYPFYVKKLMPHFWKIFKTQTFQNPNSNLSKLKLFWIYFFLLMLVFVLQWLSLHWEILIMLLSQFPLTFHQIHNGMPHFMA